MDDLYTQGAEFIRSSQNILIFTGAGLSTDSGIPDFRSPGGVWDRYDPSDFYFDNFLSSETSREKYWMMSTEMYGTIRDAKPNRAHMAIRKLEEMGKLLAIVTQNIDHLHHKAGNSPDKIVELHGTAVTVSCLSCKKPYDREEIQESIRSGIKAPICDDCGGILKPDTISFGQAMPEEEMNLAMMYAQQSDLCIVLGSSLVVYPAASVPLQAVRAGAALMIINRDPTPHDDKADLVIRDSVSDALEGILNAGYF